MHDDREPPRLDTGTWVLDPSRSTIGFRVRSAIPARGRFTEAEGAIIVDHQAGNDVTASILVDSLTTGLGLRDNHLKSAHFLDAKQHPRMEFEGRLSETGTSLRVSGTLTLRGTVRQIELTGEIGDGPDPQTSVRLHLSGDLNRRDFGVAWMSIDRYMIGSRVTLDFDLVARKN